MTMPDRPCATLSVLLKSKRPRVSAVRTFPPGCGRHALQITQEPRVREEVSPEGFAQHLVEKDREDNFKLNEYKICQPSDSTTVPLDLIPLENLISSKVPGTSDNPKPVVHNPKVCSEEVTPVDEPKSLTEPIDILDVQKEKMNLPEPLGAQSVERSLLKLKRAGSGTEAEPINTEPLGTSLPRRHESDEAFNVPSAPLQLDVAEPKATAQEKYSQPDEILVSSSSGSGKTTAKAFPSRGRVSAVRDFPPLCGRTAPCLIRDETKELVTSAEKKVLEKSSFGAENLSTKEFTSMANVKDLRLEIIEKDPQKSSKKYNIIKPNESNLERKPNEVRASIPTAKKPEERGGKAGEVSITCDKKKSMNEILVKRGSLGKKVSDQTHHIYSDATEFSSERMQPPLREERKVKELNQGSGSGARIVKKNDFILLPQAKPFNKIKNSTEDDGVEGTSTDKQLYIRVKDKPLEHDRKAKHCSGSQRSHSYDVNIPSLHSRIWNSKSDDADSIGMRRKVTETLEIFRSLCKTLSREEEADNKGPSKSRRRIDLEASKILRQSHKLVNVGKQIIGIVPGTEIGDKFQYRIELNIIGLHRPTQGGIDYLNEGGKLLATSIVASGGYDDKLTKKSDLLIYTGQGGNVMYTDKEPENQKLERGNLALANSKKAQNPVRVIYGEKNSLYFYDGLYLVEEWWQEQGQHGKLVFKFKLRRSPGQPQLA